MLDKQKYSLQAPFVILALESGLLLYTCLNVRLRLACAKKNVQANGSWRIDVGIRGPWSMGFNLGESKMRSIWGLPRITGLLGRERAREAAMRLEKVSAFEYACC